MAAVASAGPVAVGVDASSKAFRVCIVELTSNYHKVEAHIVKSGHFMHLAHFSTGLLVFANLGICLVNFSFYPSDVKEKVAYYEPLICIMQ
jgi:hypothetical protein